MVPPRIVLLHLLIWEVAITKARGGSRPNIVLFLLDDLDSELGGLTPLEKTRQLIGDQGATASNAFVTTPICCPSRSSILTGLYQHRTGVLNNTLEGNCYGRDWRTRLESTHTFAAVLNGSGLYTTFYAGKYLNRYDALEAPPGWTRWAGLEGNSVYYNYTLLVDGHAEVHGDSPSDDYLTSVIGRKADEFLSGTGSRGPEAGRPFLMVLAPPAPHAPFTYLPKYADRFEGLKAPRTPAFNNVSDSKHWLVGTRPSPLPDSAIEKVDEAFRNRWRSLLSVDDLVSGVVESLETQGLMDNTYLIFTSDNGYHLGQYGLPLDKRMPYETDIRVPLLIRGPGVPRNVTLDHPVLSIDLAATILDMAGHGLDTFTSDGRSFLPHLRDLAQGPPSDLERAFLVEYHGEKGESVPNACRPLVDEATMSFCMEDFGCKCQDSGNNTYVCLRQLSPRDSTKFCLFQDSVGFVEMYDLLADPHEMRNLASNPSLSLGWQ